MIHAMRCETIKWNSFIFFQLGLCHNNNKNESKVNIATNGEYEVGTQVAAAGTVFLQQLQKHRHEMEG